MTKEIGAKFSINGRDLPINGKVKTKYSEEGNLIITFDVGTNKLDKIKIIFNKKDYLDIENE